MLLHFILFMFTMAMGTFQGAATNNTAKPGCPTQFGNITVPYPFGIGTDCSLDGSFNLTCNTSNNEPPKSFVGKIRIYNISDSELHVFTRISYKCYSQTGVVDEHVGWTNLGRLFTFSTKNKFIVIGCDDYALIMGTNGGEFSSGCFGICRKARDVPNGEFSGIGCFQTSIPRGLSYYNITLDSLQNHKDVLSFNECGYGFLVEEGTFEFGGVNDLSTDYEGFADRIRSTVPVVLDWVIKSNGACDVGLNACKGNSTCYDVEGDGYRCKCNDGYKGNPYLDTGCQDIDECNDYGTNPCHGVCTNTLGSYTCTCPPHFIGNASMANGYQPIASKDSENISTIFIIVIISSIFAILSGIAGIYFGIRRRKLIRLREKFFEQNGGVLLKQKIKSQQSYEAVTLFSIEELRKATDRYSQENIIGKGTYGVVYKGVLSDKRVVAIKKSKLVDATQSE